MVISENKLDIVKDTCILKDHYLHCSDHLPNFLNISLEEVPNIKSEMNDKEMGVNWHKVSDDDACTYRQLFRDFTDNIVLNGPNDADIEDYITKLSCSLVHAAELRGYSMVNLEACSMRHTEIISGSHVSSQKLRKDNSNKKNSFGSKKHLNST